MYPPPTRKSLPPGGDVNTPRKDGLIRIDRVALLCQYCLQDLEHLWSDNDQNRFHQQEKCINMTDPQRRFPELANLPGNRMGVHE
jgi:hypothetical protein